MIKVSVDNNKYTFQIDPQKECDITVLRCDEPWVIIKQGSKAVMSLMQEMIELREKNEWLQKQLAETAWLP